MSVLQQAYRDAAQAFRAVYALQGAAAMLEWDRSVAGFPTSPLAAAARANQVEAVNVAAHKALSQDETLAERVREACQLMHSDNSAKQQLNEWQTRNLALMQRSINQATALPGSLVAAQAQAHAACHSAWLSAKPSNDFDSVVAPLEEVIRLAVEEGSALQAAGCGGSGGDSGSSESDAVYGALLDKFDPGCTVQDVDAVFGNLKAHLPGLIQQATAATTAHTAQATAAATLEQLAAPASAQRTLSTALMAALGFDFERGVLATAAHPFCSGVRDDTRMATWFDEADFTAALFATLHETGHALYQQGLPEAEDAALQPVGSAMGMTVHESQSLFMEMQLCRTDEFLSFAWPLIQRELDPPQELTLEAFTRHVRRVQPSLVRVYADEATYPCHVMLRTELERGLLSGDLAVRDLPSAWREVMQELLGVAPDADDHQRGVLQDLHWFVGAFGYFPTYTLGAMTAAQLFAAAKRDMPTMLPDAAAGTFQPLLAWLRRKVHSRGCLPHDRDSLLREATGEPLEARYFLDHLQARYIDC